MKYGYITYAKMLPEWGEKYDKLPAEMDRYKAHAEKSGFHMKYWGHPYGVSEDIIVMFKSEKDLGAWQIMNQAYAPPFSGQRTTLAARP